MQRNPRDAFGRSDLAALVASDDGPHRSQRRGSPENRCFVEWLADNLEADWKAGAEGTDLSIAAVPMVRLPVSPDERGIIFLVGPFGDQSKRIII